MARRRRGVERGLELVGVCGEESRNLAEVGRGIVAAIGKSSSKSCQLPVVGDRGGERSLGNHSRWAGGELDLDARTP